jgi:hypothetical protein
VIIWGCCTAGICCSTSCVMLPLPTRFVLCTAVLLLLLSLTALRTFSLVFALLDHSLLQCIYAS